MRRMTLVIMCACTCATVLFSDNTFGQETPRYPGSIISEDDHPSIVLIGDTQKTSFWEFWREKNNGIQKAVLNHIAASDPALIIHLGDLVFQGSSDGHWKDFDAFAENIHDRQIPIWPILGNHEYYGSNADALRNLFDRFPHLNEQRWSAFRFRSMGIILVDSNADEYTDSVWNEQEEWYKQQVDHFQNQDDSVRVILVAAHHPPFTNSTVVSDNVHVQDSFVQPLLDCSKPRLFFSGHSHSYERFEKDGITFIVSGGGGGPRHKLRSDGQHEDLYVSPSGAVRDFNYCRLTLLEFAIRIEMMRMDEDLIWTVGEALEVSYP